MEKNYQKVKNYLLDLEYSIDAESESNGTFIISKEDEGIKNMVIACADPILIMEQPLFVLKHETAGVLKELLKKNRDIVHGAFVLDDNNRVLFRDTLQIENLDLNELDGSLNSLSMLLSEYGRKLVEFAK
ncbi:MAG: YbjN domain-containing protein [Bacteroidales bacterium]|nr:YbjN domain-containing protein [Bacteroidales bacterium]MBQ5539508.1 YbjN domain-containing protein [Bacteroidales bacterium]MEE3448054.1 YbjN domain-containing protein [Bacteroidales bacterium]